MTKDEIIAALDEATGPDEVLDSQIWKLCEEKAGDIWELYDGAIWMRRDPNDAVAWDAAPRFTESVDAAITLVPPEFDWSISICCRGETGNGPLGTPRYQAIVIPSIAMQTNGDRRRFGGHGCFDAPSVALCSAALQARP